MCVYIWLDDVTWLSRDHAHNHRMGPESRAPSNFEGHFDPGHLFPCNFFLLSPLSLVKYSLSQNYRNYTTVDVFVQL